MSNTYLQLAISNNVGLGINVFKTTNNTGIVNVGIGGNILMNNTVGLFNTAIGTNVYASNVNGSYNTGVGANSGNANLGSNNTMLGANTGQAFGDTNIYNNSTAIGYGATVNSNNQIVLGTTTEYVKIPSTVASNSGTVGALVVGSGGMSVAGNLYVSGTVYMNGVMVSTTTNGSLNTNFGTNPLTAGNVGATTLKLLGSLTASNISVGSITSGNINAGTNPLTAGNISVGSIVGGTTIISSISSGTVTVGTMSIGTLSCGNLNINSAIISGPLTMGSNPLISGSMSVGTIIGGAATLTSVSVGTITTSLVSTGTLSAGNLNVGTLISGSINMTTNLLTAGNLSVGTITGGACIMLSLSTGSITVGSIAPVNLITGNLSTGNIISGSHNMSTNPLTCGNISVGGISAGGLTTYYLSSGTITSGNVFAYTLVTSNITTGAITYNVGLNAGVNPLTAGNLSVGTIVSSSLNMSTNPLTAGNISAGAIVTGPINLSGPYSLIAGGASVGTITTSTYKGNLFTCGGISTGSIVASLIGIGKTNPSSLLDVNGTINATNYYLNGAAIVTPASYLDGSTSAKAAPSAKFIQQTFFKYTDGPYWINLPNVGPTRIYCIMDTAYAGGGWMLAIKASAGTTFPYSSTYWTSINTLNSTDLTRNDGDAKYDTFNFFPATDWFAIFPGITSGGDIPTSLVNTGWTWVENNAIGRTMTLVDWCALGTQYTKLSNGVGTYSNGSLFYATNPIPLNSTKYYSNNNTTTFNQAAASPVWSSQFGFQWYGFNYTSCSDPLKYMRWGFGFNNELDQTSNDNKGGIGNTSWSAGNDATSYRFEWYIR